MDLTFKIRSRIKDVVDTYLKGQSLKARVGRSGVWLGAGNSAERLLRLLRNMILTRMLAPEVFGVMALVLSANEFFESLTQIGIKNAIIQNPNGQDQIYLNGAWWLSFCRGLVLYIIAYFFIPLISRFYENPDLVPLMRVAFLSIVFLGLTSSQAYVALKKLDFKRWVIITQGGGICGVFVSLALAYTLQNVWALVIGFIVGYVMRCILSYIICPFRPGLKFNREYLSALFKYARGMLGAPILLFIFMRTDIFVLGKLLSESELGLYAMASALARIPLLFIGSMIHEIVMPVYSEAQNDKGRLNQYILKTTLLIVFIGFPALFLSIFYGREILTIIYGAQYAAVAVPFAIIFASEFLRTSSNPIAVTYLAIGRPGIQRFFTGIRAFCILALIYPFVKWFGLIGASSAVLIAMIIGYFFQLHRIHKMNGISIAKYSSIFFWAFCFSLCVFVVWIGTHIFISQQYFVKLILIGLLGCIISYCLSLVLFPKIKRKIV